jgi:hypothetical protein
VEHLSSPLSDFQVEKKLDGGGLHVDIQITDRRNFDKMTQNADFIWLRRG